ncbi:hypothetical protein BHM03_00007038 [Ensete ventricosum]|nr:hypothetical protein BHM03_00007038 [Ensete ventricosum]
MGRVLLLVLLLLALFFNLLGSPLLWSFGSFNRALVDQVRMSSSDSSSVRSIPFVRSEGMSLGSTEVSTLGTSSEAPSSIDARALMDLEVMKACHDFKSIVTKGALAAIQKRYSILGEYALHAPLPEQRLYNLGSSELSILVDALEASLHFPLHPVIKECLRAYATRSLSSKVIERALWDNCLQKRRGVLCCAYDRPAFSRSRLLYVNPVGTFEEFDASLGRSLGGIRVREGGSAPPISEGDVQGVVRGAHGVGAKAYCIVEQRVVAVEQRANDLQANNDKLMAQLVEVTQRMELSDKELNDAGADLFDAQRELME